jgi:dCMP deaminase
VESPLDRGPEYRAARRELRDKVNLNHAYEEASLAICTRRQVGAFVAIGPSLVVVGTGYNGTPPGKPHCSFEEKGCERGLRSKEEVPPGGDYNAPGWTCKALHAEHNAILTAVEAVGRPALAGGTIYITDEPCPQCATLIESVGITRIITRERLMREFGDRRDPKSVKRNKELCPVGDPEICERQGCGHVLTRHRKQLMDPYGRCQAGCGCWAPLSHDWS